MKKWVINNEDNSLMCEEKEGLGFGSYIYESGDFYVGEMKDGLFNGIGMLNRPKGNLTFGYYEDDNTRYPKCFLDHEGHSIEIYLDINKETGISRTLLISFIDGYIEFVSRDTEGKRFGYGFAILPDKELLYMGHYDKGETDPQNFSLDFSGNLFRDIFKKPYIIRINNTSPELKKFKQFSYKEKKDGSFAISSESLFNPGVGVIDNRKEDGFSIGCLNTFEKIGWNLEHNTKDKYDVLRFYENYNHPIFNLYYCKNMFDKKDEFAISSDDKRPYIFYRDGILTIMANEVPLFYGYKSGPAMIFDINNGIFQYGNFDENGFAPMHEYYLDWLLTKELKKGRPMVTAVGEGYENYLRNHPEYFDKNRHED